MGVSLTKGGNVSLTKAAPGLTAVNVGLGWDVRTPTGADFDLDASALLLGCRGEICRRSHALGKLREAAAAQDPFRIALMDMSPPVPEVFALSRAIASDAAIAMAVRICCTESPVRGESRLKEFGFAGVIQKPVTPAVLKEALVEALEGA